MSVASALAASQRAVIFDVAKKYDAAAYYYKEAAKLLYIAMVCGEASDDEKEDWRQKIKKYEDRAEILERAGDGKNEKNAQSVAQQALQRCNFLFGQALDADENQLIDIAIDLYKKTAEFALSSRDSIDDESCRRKMTQRAEQAVTRAEELKFQNSKDSNEIVAESPEESGSKLLPRKNQGYTLEEKQVLLSTSKINEIIYVPFMDIDLKERFQYSMPFTDKDGMLALAPKQKEYFSGWARPEELFPEPKMINDSCPNFLSIRQEVISDCSFVASLAVSAQYERKFKKRIITSIIYPKNRNKQPIYNPFGKYMVKLHINGVHRKVIIDDFLPVDRHGRLLCSYSTQKGELWVSLLEKAYMKVMGGYDFPGSSGNTDMHALTGWIPERINLQDTNTNYNAIFTMLETRMENGHCLATIGTGELTKLEEERSGLAPTHAYAILDVKTVHGVQLMQLKNPWSQLRWRGNYSEMDIVHWTPAMRAALNFDPDNAATFDNGIFWIDFESVLKFFHCISVNWNPEIFPHTYCIHEKWLAGHGPAKDAYNIGENPQFRLNVPGTKSGSVWVHLIRHITDIEDFRNNREFITVLVYKTNGARVFYPADPAPYINGTRINSPHYLCKIKLNENLSRTFTLVVSQYEKTANIFFTLRAYSTLPFKLEKIFTPYSCTKKINCEWKGATAGGCVNHRQTYNQNPCFHLEITTPGSYSLLVDLKGPKEYAIGFNIEKIGDGTSQFTRPANEAYRFGFFVLELNSVPHGVYSIIPTTYSPGQEAPFILTVKATCNFTITRVK